MINSFIHVQMYYDVRKYLNKYMGYLINDINDITVSYQIIDEKYNMMLLDLKKREASGYDIKPLIFAILYSFQIVTNKDIYKNKNIKQFIEDAITLLKKEYIFKEEHLNEELNYALDHYPNYSLHNNSSTLNDIKSFLNSDLEFSQCERFLIGKINPKYGTEFPIIDIPLEDFGITPTNSHSKWKQIQIVSIK